MKHIVKSLLFLVMFSLLSTGTMDADNVAQIGETGYETLVAALEAWANGTTLKLLADQELTDEITISVTRTLDLNGYGLKQTTANKCLFIVADGGSLTINDTEASPATRKFRVDALTHKAVLDGDGGKSFTGGYLCGGTGHSGGTEHPYRGGAILVQKGGSLTMTGGTILGNSAPFGGAVAVRGGMFTMSGGAIIYNSNVRGGVTDHGGSAVWVEKDVSDATFTMSGTATIEHNYTPTNSFSDTKGQVTIFGTGANCVLAGGTPKIQDGENGINLQLLDGNVATISTAAFASGAHIGVTVNHPARVFTSGYNGQNSGVPPATYFHSDDTNYYVLYEFVSHEATLCAEDARRLTNGVFTVAKGKTVQFARKPIATRPATRNLYQWDEVDDLVGAANGEWDVLTGDEWSYLLASGRTNAENLNNVGTVAGDSGLIILPDGWVQPAGVPEYKPVSKGIDYTLNMYTAGEWEIMAQSGAVFLPCGGYGYNDAKDDDKYKVENPTDHGAYWAKDEVSGGSANAYSMKFNTSAMGSIHDFTAYPKTNYYSVILVKRVTVPVLYEEHDTTAFIGTDLSAAKGSPVVYVHRTMKKDSTLYTLCLPFDVPNVDASPLASAEIYEFTGGQVSGSTGNERLHLNMKRLEGKRLTRGTPYILRWIKVDTVPNIDTLRFFNVENWADNVAVDTVGNAVVKFHGAYPKTHIKDYAAGVAHYHFFIGANDSLYWPDASYKDHKMKGFRAYFSIEEDAYPAGAPARGLQAIWEVDGAPLDDTEGVESLQPSAVSVQKELREGQIVIVIDGKEYDIRGWML